ncbi:MAG: bifunctional diguanylate cyclase/phosphodiesterase [Candidatus Thiodiazotropha sp. (ex Troendleina suluensis)]|nr:bifunctional diguanylate cyclase/phosphodiesterase [Candidatus Thiodiazotropha sp. (ex Troendleina suluensis)]
MKLHYKIYVALILALLAGLTFFYSKSRTDVLLSGHNQVMHNLAEIKLLNKRLDEEIWSTAYRLYHNYDEVHRLIKEIRKLEGKIRLLDFLASAKYQPFREKMDNFNQRLQQKEQAILRFDTLNSLIKNSVSQVPGLTHRFIKNFTNEDQEYMQDLSQATTLVFLASNALDAELLTGFKEVQRRLQDKEFTDPERKRFNHVFLSHARIIDKYLAEYIPVFTGILDIPIDKALNGASELFLDISKRQAESVHLWSLSITLAFIGSLGMIVFFLVNLDKRHRELSVLHTALERGATIDNLTGLKNRYSFERSLNVDAEQALIIINIDGFKHINNFYSHEAGDRILVQMAEVLQSTLALSKHELFRLGGDDFGILIEGETDDLEMLTRKLIRTVEQTLFSFGDNPIPINITAGMSRATPLLDTANLTLNRIKRTRMKFLAYNPELGEEARMKDNLTMIRVLKEAINNDSIIPYFMPIMNNRNHRIERYECLIRVKAGDGTLLLPNEFLHVAREGRLNADLTKIMIEKCFKAFADTDLEFSINLAIEDILDPEVTNFLFNQLEHSPGIGRRLTLEILESEEVNSYEAIADFTRHSIDCECRIAIDDFGSGYSNLRHLLKLNIHMLKIDGSLIRNIIEDPHSAQAIQAITTLAHKIGITSIVAEYVNSKEIQRLVSEMGIEYSQGYYIGKPMPHLLSLSIE